MSFYDPLIFELLKMLRAYSPACRRRRINPIKCVQLSTGSRNKATSAQSWNRRITLKISPLFIRLVAYPTTDSRTFKVHFIEINNPYKSSLNGFANNVCLRQTFYAQIFVSFWLFEKSKLTKIFWDKIHSMAMDHYILETGSFAYMGRRLWTPLLNYSMRWSFSHQLSIF